MGQAAKKTKGTTKANAIAGFYPDKIDGAAIRSFVAEQKIDLPVAEDATADQLAVALTLYFREKVSQDDMCKCEVCGGEAPDAYVDCPFCGLESADPDDLESEASNSEEGSDSEENEGDKSSGDVVTEIVETAKENNEDEMGATETSTAGSKGKKKAKKEGEMGTSKAAAKSKSNGSTALAKRNEGGAEIVELKPGTRASEKDLDASVERVFALKQDSASAYFALCCEILDINKRGLWKLRKDADGKVKYSGFDAFCEQELNMSSANAFGMMKTAREMTAEDVAAIGKSKAILVLKAAPADRKRLVKKAKAGATARELKRDVKRSRERSGYVGDTDAAKRGAKGGKKKAANVDKGVGKTPPQDKITVAKIEGLKTIKLYARPASLKNLNLDDCKRAAVNQAVQKWIESTQPFGRIELTNGVVMYVSISVGKDGNAIAKVDTRRESPAE